MAKNRKTPDMNLPVWFDGQNINEALFCEEFLHERRIIFANGAFFTPDGRVTDDLPLRGEIYDKLKFCAVNNIPRKITNILEVLKLEAQVPDFPPEQDRIHVFNGTLLLNGTFTEGRPAIVRSRLPVVYNPDAPAPVIWLNFLNGLLHAEDIPTLQEFIGYCLIPSNKGQRMMVIKGNGGEGKSQIGAVLSAIFGTNMKDGSIGKISENRFARADLEHILLCVDDDMRMEALRQTNYVKSIVTAQGKMDLERKGKQSYQGWMFARLLTFSNGDLQALYDRSDGFYRRQLMEKQIAVLQGQLKQAFGTKSRLERQMDTLDINDAHYDRKILDLQRRYDEQYDTIEEIEVQIGELQSQIRSIQQEKISGDNIYRLLLAFDEVYHSATEAEQKEFMKAFIERIEMFPEKRKDGSWIKKIVFNFPVPVDGEEVKELPLETETTVEAVLLLTKLNVVRHIEVDGSMDELDVTAAESKATYNEIREYVWEHHQLKVSNLYIAQVKQKHGIIERDNYHKAKNENAKQPQCPKEKEDAIVEALKHFQMI